MSDEVDSVLNVFSGAGDAAASLPDAATFESTVGAGASDVAGAGASAAGDLGGAIPAATQSFNAPSDAASFLGASSVGGGTGNAAADIGAGPSAGAAGALGASPVASSGPAAFGGGSAPAGAIGDVSAGQVASQVGGGATDVAGAPKATDVGSLTGTGTSNFGGDFAPSQAVEGKPEVPDSANFFGKGGQLNSVLNDPGARLGLAALPAAATLIKGQPSVPAGIGNLQQGGAVTAPLIAAENSQLGAANSGQLTQPQAAQIAQFTQQAQSQLFQQLANSGVADPTKDSRYVSGLQQIQQQAQAMTQNFIQQEFTTGFAAAGQAANTLTTAANAEVQQDNNFQSALNSALQSFGLVEGLSGTSRAAA